MELVDVAIVGAGPAGLSAAARAARRGLSHLLIERADHLSDTIYKYQKKKLVMATPDRLPLQSDLEFRQAVREEILGWWDRSVADLGVNLRMKAEVTAVSGEKGDFTVEIAGQAPVRARHVVLSVGLQGNLRKFDPAQIPGADRINSRSGQPMCGYQLDDPAAFFDKDVIVVGAGDAAIENAVALAEADNRVTIVNRGREFARAKSGNVSLILAAIKDERLQVAYNAAPASVEDGAVVLKTPEGLQRLPADHVIARLGAEAPKEFVTACGGVFEKGSQFPRVSDVYESDRPGLFIIGALAGYPLIKHCMNQGYEVVDYIATGVMPEGPDIAILREKFRDVPGADDITALLEEVRGAVPLFGGLTILQLREFLLDAVVHAPADGEHLIRRNTAGDSLYVVQRGAVELVLPNGRAVRMGRGAFFGEMGLIMGRRRTADVVAANDGAQTVCIEIPRTAALKLIASSPVAKRVMDETALLRQLQTFLSPDLTADDLSEVLAASESVRFGPREALIQEGAEDEDLFVIRNGSCTVSRSVDGQDTVLGYVAAGAFVGEMALLFRQRRSATVRATVPVEAVKINAGVFRDLLGAKPRVRAVIEAKARERTEASAASFRNSEAAQRIDFLTRNGIGEATNAIVIDERLCIRCDYCEKACAETHDGISRLDRDAGPTFAELHLPLSCRHCEQPHCMADCPPNALYRTESGAVEVNDACIGCGNCVRNCPYDAIRLSAKPAPRAPLLVQLLFGARHGIGERAAPKKSDKNRELARKCDLCESVSGGPACVRACPTGAVIRVGPEQLFDMIRRRG